MNLTCLITYLEVVGPLALDHIFVRQGLVLFGQYLLVSLVLLAPLLEVGIGVLQDPELLHGLLPVPEDGVAVPHDLIEFGLCEEAGLWLGIMIFQGLGPARLTSIPSMLDFIMYLLDLLSMTVTPRPLAG